MIYAEFEVILVAEKNPKAFLILANMKKMLLVVVVIN